MNHEDRRYLFGSAAFQTLFAVIRVLILLRLLVFFATTFSYHFHDLSAQDLLFQVRMAHANLRNWPDWLGLFVASLITPEVFRYLIAPVSGLLAALFIAAHYVKDVYALPKLSLALRYILASLFAIRYPKLVIDSGVRELAPKEVNLIDRIGGPGSVSIEPGSAAVFRHLREPSRSMIAGTYFLAPFETIAYTVDLDEQQADRDRIPCMTRDGLKVVLSDVHFRYQIKQQVVWKGGRSRRKSVDDPYPFEHDAIGRMMNNLSVEANGGQESWNTAVERMIVGEITDFVAANDIDYLTAPRGHGWNPQVDVKSRILERTRIPLERLGAELLWIDTGHLEIVDDSVDEQRVDLWAADWIGDAQFVKAYGEAKRSAYQELGRAEAQAELILGIASALTNASVNGNSRENVRKLLLARTAQILDAMSGLSDGKANGSR